MGLRIKSEKKKILLLVDNCPAHPHVINLNNIKLVFLPANTMSVLQSMAQSIIQSFKEVNDPCLGIKVEYTNQHSACFRFC